MVALTVMVLTSSYAMPIFQKTLEQARVDIAANYLETLWTAQRLYNAQNHVFSDSIETLKQANLLDVSFPGTSTAANARFAYSITYADTGGFCASAVRVNSAHWSGQLSINEQGRLTGEIAGLSGETVSFSQG